MERSLSGRAASYIGTGLQQAPITTTWADSVLRIAVRITATIALTIGSVLFTAWIIWPNYHWTATSSSVKTNMALSQALAGGALLILSWRPGGTLRAIALLFAVVVFLIGMLTLSEHLFGWNLGIDQLIAKEPAGMWGTVSPNRMGPPGSTGLSLIGLALILAALGKPRAVPYLSIGVCVLTLVPAIGYLYGIVSFYSAPRVTGIGWPSVIALISLGAGTLFLNAEQGPVRLLLNDDAGGRLLRSLLPAALFLPIALGFVRVLGEGAGLYDLATGRGLLVLTMVILMTLLLYRSARRLSHADEQRKAAEENLRAEEERFRLAIRATNDAIWDIDLENNTVYWNENYSQVFGRPADFKHSRQWRIDRIHPEDQARTIEGLFGAIEGNETLWTCEYRFRRADGTWANVHDRAYIARDPSGRAVRVVGAMLDLTQRRLAEQELRTLATVVEKSDDFIGLCRPDMSPFFVNEAGRRMVGLDSPEEVLQTHVLDYFWPDDLPLIQTQAIPTLLKEGRWSGEVRFRHFKTGEPIYTRWEVFTIRDQAGEITAWATVSPNLGEIKAAERKLREAMEAATIAQAEAERASAAKDHFLAVLSHELRTPLTPALAAAQSLEADARLDRATRESAGLIRRNVEMEARLIDDLLDLTRISRGKISLQLQHLDLHEQVRQAVTTCEEEAATKRLSVQLDLKAESHHIQGDPTRVQQIIWNLVRNAVKFTPINGQIRIETENSAPDKVVVIVADNGVGIAPEYLDGVFRPFEQGGAEISRLFGGLGLGLSISKGLVELHGGAITAESEGVGKGARFRLELPVSTAVESAETNTFADPVENGARRNCRVLLVEDHADTSKVMSRLITRWGYEVTTAGSVAEAVDATRTTRFDLLISDLGLPDGTGYDVMRQLAPITPLPGIALSGYGQPEDVARTLEAGFREHLVKPVDLRKLRESIDRLVREVCA